MDKFKRIMFSFRIHKELYDYLKDISKKEYTSVSGYLTELIKKDKEKRNDNNKGS
jgi:ribosomal protein S17E